MSFAPWQLFCLWLYVLTVWMAAVLGHKMWWCICNGVWIRFCIHIFKQVFNTSRPRQNGCHFADDSFKWIFLNENLWISIEVSLKFVPKGPTYNIPALVQIIQAPSHYLNQWWLVYWRIYVSLGLNELTHWGGPNKLSAILRTKLLSAISWNKLDHFF